MVTEEEKSVETTMRGRKAIARCGRADEEEVDVDTRQQSSNQVRTTEEEKRIAILNGKEFSCICFKKIFNFSKLILQLLDRNVTENRPNRDFLSHFYPKVEELALRN